MRASTFLRAALAACSFLSIAAFAKPTLHFSGARGAAIDIDRYDARVTPDAPLRIGLTFDRQDAERLRALMRANLGERVAIRIGDQTILLPTVRSVPEGDGLELSLQDQPAAAAVQAALTAPSPGK